MFKVYSSSAGSGKTYTLTKEYLKLALHSNSDTYFRQILAVTFTNAAANEMKERILLMLRTFSDAMTSTAAEHPMLRDVVTELYPVTLTDPALYAGAKELISVRAQLVFRQILHRYSDFSVMTIDKFTQRLISSFTDELGIPFVFETQLDGTLLDEAVDRLLARIGQEGEDVLSDIVEKYYREKAEEGKSWASLPAQIRETAGTLLSEQSYLQMQRVSNLQMGDWVAIRNQMRAFVKGREESIKRLALSGFELIVNEFLTDKDFYQGARGIYGYFKDRSEGKNIWTAPNSYVSGKTIGEENWYGAKTAAPIKDKIESIRAELERLYHAIENIRNGESQKITLYQQLEKHLYNLSLLGEIRKEFDALLRQNNQVHISDFNRRILEIVAKEPVPFIFERLGEKYNHILVDEFQDTSKLQFANLLPLIENALADGYFNLIVGDAKQSIYRFRGGDMDLILHLAQNQVMALVPILGNNVYNEERLWSVDSQLEIDHLRTNRRSYREITTFNNQFFGFISDTVGQEFPLIKSVYDENFKQEIPDGVKDGGHVQLEFLDMQEGADEFSEVETKNDAIVKRSLELITELRETGYQWRDIAILCRKKKEATSLANALKEIGYPLISDDALSLGYSRSVHFVISFMEVLHTDQRLKRYEAAYLFHRVIRKEIPTAQEHEALRELCIFKGLDSFLAYFAKYGVELTAFRMRQLTVFELSELLMQTFGLFENKTESEYLFRFLDVVLEFGTRRSNHLGDFLQHWETAKNKLSITIPSDTDALRITTIHKSKGLEYPVVIVPYANWKVTPNAKLDRLWIDLEDISYDELSLAEKNEEVAAGKKLKSSLVSVVKDLDNTLVAEQYQDEKTRTLVENLNLLYVAFTRPVQRLYVLSKREKNWNQSSQVSNWMHDFLSQENFQPAYNEIESKYVLSQGDGDYFHAHARSNSESFIIDDIISNDRTDSLRLRRMAERIFDVETFERKKDHLQKMRHLLITMNRVKDLGDAEGQLVRDGIVTREEAKNLYFQLTDLFKNESLKDLYSEAVKIQVNKELLLPGGKMLHVDRIVQLPDESYVFMSFVAGIGSDQSRQHLKRLVKVYTAEGKSAAAVLITLENDGIEWIL
ncbi:UvrD-helicase domain-containing protein [Dyadobacter sp. CY345]|uniref:UvrD-helicase domain-containing protein n=1 Tax=Dyadobacter sp. CY345 TaxID=2909335 RepID=UPI001F2A588C|nr:UvrD-helicase domain-containing protein [Dyadobacter sp. CY345]MCF2446429.1 UvrD-helicase domain-containing protein [Dyadobacter sp. CY345]